MKTIRLTISGKVQGVYYRQSTREKAKALGIHGIVKNLPNGSVEILATGSEGQLHHLEQWCKTGPARAIVNSVEKTIVSLQLFEDFIIVR